MEQTTSKATASSANSSGLHPLRSANPELIGNAEEELRSKRLTTAQKRKRESVDHTLTEQPPKRTRVSEATLQQQLKHLEQEALNASERNTPRRILSTLVDSASSLILACNKTILHLKLPFFLDHQDQEKQEVISKLKAAMPVICSLVEDIGLMLMMETKPFSSTTSMANSASGPLLKRSVSLIDIRSDSQSKEDSPYGSQSESTSQPTFTQRIGSISQEDNNSTQPWSGDLPKSSGSEKTVPVKTLGLQRRNAGDIFGEAERELNKYLTKRRL